MRLKKKFAGYLSLVWKLLENKIFHLLHRKHIKITDSEEREPVESFRPKRQQRRFEKEESEHMNDVGMYISQYIHDIIVIKNFSIDF